MPCPIRFGPEPRISTFGPLGLRRDLRLGRRVGLVGAVVVRRARGELGGAGVDGLVDRPDAEPVAQGAHAVLAGELRAQRGELAVGEPGALGPAQQRLVEHRRVASISARSSTSAAIWSRNHGSIPVRRRQLRDARARRAAPARRRRSARRSGSARVGGLGRVRRDPEPAAAVLHRAQRLAQRLGERAAERHRLADALHRGGQLRVRARELLEGEPRHLDHDVVQRRLERRGRLAGDVVADLVEGVADGQLRRDLRDREAGGLGRQRGRPRHPRVHLDDDQPAGLPGAPRTGCCSRRCRRRPRAAPRCRRRACAGTRGRSASSPARR